ncbi:putative TM Protein [Veiled chameleon serpentovirus B]|uniref:TM Protein n=1 Tax=Veiled chameleon serpentovirus B TaxID=2806430 RepID=A0AAE7P749_9NIDO|nr:putative TM Protein [Veiled chameleon serpentovirus B]QRC47043.1 putative TM Protein [Veiled chameleon serpentovirus B]
MISYISFVVVLFYILPNQAKSTPVFLNHTKYPKRASIGMPPLYHPLVYWDDSLICLACLWEDGTAKVCLDVLPALQTQNPTLYRNTTSKNAANEQFHWPIYSFDLSTITCNKTYPLTNLTIVKFNMTIERAVVNLTKHPEWKNPKYEQLDRNIFWHLNVTGTKMKSFIFSDVPKDTNTPFYRALTWEKSFLDNTSDTFGTLLSQGIHYWPYEFIFTELNVSTRLNMSYNPPMLPEDVTYPTPTTCPPQVSCPEVSCPGPPSSLETVSCPEPSCPQPSCPEPGFSPTYDLITDPTSVEVSGNRPTACGPCPTPTSFQPSQVSSSLTTLLTLVCPKIKCPRSVSPELSSSVAPTPQPCLTCPSCPTSRLSTLFYGTAVSQPKTSNTTAQTPKVCPSISFSICNCSIYGFGENSTDDVLLLKIPYTQQYITSFSLLVCAVLFAALLFALAIISCCLSAPTPSKIHKNKSDHVY